MVFCLSFSAEFLILFILHYYIKKHHRYYIWNKLLGILSKFLLRRDWDTIRVVNREIIIFWISLYIMIKNYCDSQVNLKNLEVTISSFFRMHILYILHMIINVFLKIKYLISPVVIGAVVAEVQHQKFDLL